MSEVSSILEIGHLLGLRGRFAQHDLKKIERGVRAYYAKHEKCPSKVSGDASKYVGYKTTWSSIDHFLQTYGHGSLSEFCKQTGLGGRAEHDLKKIERGVRKFYKQHECCPTGGDGDASSYVGYETTWLKVTRWVPYHYGVIFVEFCRGLGLHTNIAPHDLKKIKKGIQQFCKRHGERPNQRSGDATKYVGYKTAWNNIHGYLYKHHHTTLHQLCDELGIPGGHRMSRTKANVQEEVVAFFNEYGRRPGIKDKRLLNKWLESQGSSLRALCDELGFPPTRVYGRTMEDCRKELQGWYDKHGKCPTGGDLPNVNAWLRVNGGKFNSIAKLAKVMGLNDDMTMNKARQILQVFFDERGQRPSRVDGKSFSNLDVWLRRAGRKSSLKKLCDEMGLPERNGAKREVLSKKILVAGCIKYRDAHGQWPPQSGNSAEPYLGIDMTWRAVHLSVLGGFRGMPGGQTLPQMLLALPRSVQKCQRCGEKFRSPVDSRLYCSRTCSSRSRSQAHYYAKKQRQK